MVNWLNGYLKVRLVSWLLWFDCFISLMGRLLIGYLDVRLVNWLLQVYWFISLMVRLMTWLSHDHIGWSTGW